MTITVENEIQDHSDGDAAFSRMGYSVCRGMLAAQHGTPARAGAGREVVRAAAAAVAWGISTNFSLNLGHPRLVHPSHNQGRRVVDAATMAAVCLRRGAVGNGR